MSKYRDLSAGEELLLMEFASWLTFNSPYTLCIFDYAGGDIYEQSYDPPRDEEETSPEHLIRQFLGLSKEEWALRTRRQQLDSLRENSNVPSWLIEAGERFLEPRVETRSTHYPRPRDPEEGLTPGEILDRHIRAGQFGVD